MLQGRINKRRMGLNLPGLAAGCFLAVLCALGGPVGRAAEDTVNIKLLVVNPSDDKKLTTEITHALPPEVMPEHIIDASGMDTVYDKDKNTYVLRKEVVLAPLEKRTVFIKVKNVWVIPDEEMQEIRNQISDDFKALEGTKYFETAKLLFEKAEARLDQIDVERSQKLGIRQQIELYRSHRKQLPEIRNGILSMESLHKLEAQADGEERTVTFNITAQNPASQPRTMTVRTDMPKDIKSSDILEKQDFVVLFDDAKQVFALELQEEFGPKEVKTYKIVLRDIWYIPQEYLNRLQEQTERLIQVFEPTDFAAYAQEGTAYIQKMIQEISVTQEELGEDSGVDQRMRAFVMNSQKLKLAKSKLKELQDLLLELPIKSKEDTIQKIMRGIAQVQKVEEVSKLLSMGIDPKTSTTWWIIFGIIIFLAVIAISFYVTWLVKLNQATKQQKTAAK